MHLSRPHTHGLQISALVSTRSLSTFWRVQGIRSICSDQMDQHNFVVLSNVFVRRTVANASWSRFFPNDLVRSRVLSFGLRFICEYLCFLFGHIRIVTAFVQPLLYFIHWQPWSYIAVHLVFPFIVTIWKRSHARSMFTPTNEPVYVPVLWCQGHAA